MPKFDTSTPRTPAKYMGIDFQVPYVFPENHPLTANEAKFLNRQVATVIGNTYGGRLRKALAEVDEKRAAEAKAKTYTGPMDASGKKPAPATVADINWDHQKEFDELFADYELGVSNRGSGAEPKDPLGAETYSIAAAQVREAIKKLGKKVPDFYTAKARDADKYNNRFNELVAEFTTANPWVVEVAKAKLAAVGQHATAEPTLDLDVEEEAEGEADTNADASAA